MELPDQPTEEATYYWGFNESSKEPCIIWELPAVGVCATHKFEARSPANNNFHFVRSLTKISLHDSYEYHGKFWQIISIEALEEPIGDPEVVAKVKRKREQEAEEERQREIRFKEQQELNRIENERRAKLREEQRIQQIADEKVRQAEEAKLQKAREKEQAKARIQDEKRRKKEQVKAQRLKAKQAWENRGKYWETLTQELRDLLPKLLTQKPDTAQRNLNKLLADYRGVFVTRGSFESESAFSTRYLKLYNAQKSGFIAAGHKMIRINEVSECNRHGEYIKLIMKSGSEHYLDGDTFSFVEQLFS